MVKTYSLKSCDWKYVMGIEGCLLDTCHINFAFIKKILGELLR